MWTDTFDAFFFITAGGLLLAAFKYSVEYCLKSKCSQFELCCIKIHRDVRVEAEIESRTLEARAAGVQIPDSDHHVVIPPMPSRRATV